MTHNTQPTGRNRSQSFHLTTATANLAWVLNPRQVAHRSQSFQLTTATANLVWVLNFVRVASGICFPTMFIHFTANHNVAMNKFDLHLHHPCISHPLTSKSMHVSTQNRLVRIGKKCYAHATLYTVWGHLIADHLFYVFAPPRKHHATGYQSHEWRQVFRAKPDDSTT